jgi:acyl-CoA thioester hydrolase
MVVHSHNDYFGPISFPAVAELGLRVTELGKSSVRYEIALFEKGVDEVKAVGQFVHVFVDRDTGRPARDGMNDDLRNGLSKVFARPLNGRL